MNSFVISSILIITSGFIVMSFRKYAEKYGWAIGKVYYSKEKLLGVFVWICVIPGVFQLIYSLSFIKGLGITALLFFVAPVLIYMFKTWSQYLWMVLFVASIIVWIVGGVQVIQVK